jgi:hypothetical protein
MSALLDLVRRLIDYGKELAETLHQRVAENPYFPGFTYGTNDLALIMARITRGLLRAQALEARLIRLAARPMRPSAPATAAPPRKPHTDRPTVHRQPAADTPPTDLPTVDQIAAEIRRRPIGAIIADICRDLRILPSHPLWRDLQHAINHHGGSYIRLLKDLLKRGTYQLPPLDTAPPIAPPSLFPPAPAPAGTGPP